MGHVVTLTSRSMVTIPAMIMAKYGLRHGSKIEIVEAEGGFLLRPIKSSNELRDARLALRSIRARERELETEDTDEAATHETASPSARGAMNFLSAHSTQVTHPSR